MIYGIGLGRDNLLGPADLLARLDAGEMTPAEFVKLSREFGMYRTRQLSEPVVVGPDDATAEQVATAGAVYRIPTPRGA